MSGTGSPSAILSRAADLIRDTAERATDGPWVERFDAPGRIVGPYGAPVCELRSPMPDGRWIALMSPAVAPMIEAMLREYARCAEELDYAVDRSPDGEAMLALARVIVGEEVQHG